VPLVCEFMPMRWSYEALVVAQAKLNPLTKRQRKIQDEIDAIVEMKPRPPEIRDRLEDLKDALAFLSGLEAGSTIGVDKRLERIDALINGEKVDFRALRTNKNMESAERMYVNRKTLDLVSKAETEQSDYRRRRYLGQEPPYINVFFGPEKSFFNWVLSVFFVNTVVLLSFSFASLLILYVSIRRQLTVRAR
jgi:hypothetical protein